MESKFEVGKKVKYNSEYKRLFSDRKDLNEIFEITAIDFIDKLNEFGKITKANEPLVALSNNELISGFWLELVN